MKPRSGVLPSLAFMFLAGMGLLAGDIHEAARKGDEEALLRILNQHPDALHRADRDGSTALHLAVKKGHVKLVQVLLERGANANASDCEGDTPLHFAALAKQHDLISMLLKHGADVNASDANRFTPIFYSAIRDDLPGIQQLQKQGGELRGTAIAGGSLLHYAAMSASPKVLEYLIQQGLDVHARSTNLETSLHWALYRLNTKAIDPLLAGGAKLNGVFDEWGNSPLGAAILEKDLPSAKVLLARGATINQPNPNGRTPLHLAVGPSNERIHLPVVQFLIENGADVRAVQKDGTSVLAWAVRYCPADIVRLLLERGAPVDGLPEDALKVDHHVLHQALLGHKAEVVAMILKEARQLELRDAAGRTPLHLAVATGQTEAVKALLDRGADPRCLDDEGRSLLHIAAIHGYDDLLERLLACDLPPAARDKSGRTASAYAARYGHGKVSRLLSESGANSPSPKVATAKKALAVKLAPGQAQVWYLGHSGWAVRTRNHLLVFDYWNPGRKPVEASLANGHIVPEELRDLKVTVFVSFLMPDHWDKTLFEWPKRMKDCTLVYGFNPAKLATYTGPAYQGIAEHETKTLQGIEISTLQANVGGVGYLIKVDGITLLHSGDHFNRQADLSGSFCGEIDRMASMKPKVDLAFLPVHEDGLLEPAVILRGTRYILDKLKPAVVFPMHAGGQEKAYQDFIRDFGPKYPSVHFVGARSRGDHVLVSPRSKRAVIHPGHAGGDRDSNDQTKMLLVGCVEIHSLMSGKKECK